ncbi:hypothetical protein EXE42_18100, partial [Halorubrum sp. SP3]
EEPEKADRSVVEPNNADEPEEERDDTADETPDAGLVESEHETRQTDGLDRPRVRTPDEQIRMGTSKVDKDTADKF